MQINEEQEISIEDFFSLCENEGGVYQIDTPDGWQDIVSLVTKRDKECYNLVFDNNDDLGCSSDHYVLTDKGEWKKAEDIDVQKDAVCSRTGLVHIVDKEYLGKRNTFDLELNNKEHRYYSNDIISHNTGKSMTCDALAHCWQMPLLRLDIGSIFGSRVGESEDRMRTAISVAESVSPCVLWMDEVEKGIGGVQSSNQTDGGVTNRVFATLLTWMQEKTTATFVVCTANNVASLPPEFMRAGRFDEIFFVDLPDKYQREEVTTKLLTKKNRDPKLFDVKKISQFSSNYSPAEIEKAINNALFVVYADSKRELTTDDIINALSNFQPLYNSKKDEIQEMREWALGEEGQGGSAVLANSLTPEKSFSNESSCRGLDLSENDL